MTDADPTATSRHEDGVVRSDGTIDPAHRLTLSYIDRSRRFYAAQGYERPYRWATNESTPFHRPQQPVTASRLAVVTTSFPVEEHAGSSSPKSLRATATDPPPQQMYTDDLFWHKDGTHTEDVDTFLPLSLLAEAVDSGRLGSLNHRFFSVPTTYSRSSSQRDAEVLARWCGDDDVDLVLLVPL